MGRRVALPDEPLRDVEMNEDEIERASVEIEWPERLG